MENTRLAGYAKAPNAENGVGARPSADDAKDPLVRPTSRKRPAAHREELARLRAEVRALRGELRRARRLATLGTMTAMVAHEFNNILTPVVNYAHLAEGNPQLWEKAARQAAAGGQRAHAICNAILSLARNAPAASAEASLLSIVNETLSAMARDPRRDGIDLRVEVPADIRLVTRPVELQQVLLNLLINAWEAVLRRSPPRQIELRAEARDGCVAMIVHDNGAGIPRQDLRRIFEPFFTTRAGGDGPAGTGLGLAFCRQAVRSLGGRILVSSGPGQGTTFRIVFPRRALAAAGC